MNGGGSCRGLMAVLARKLLCGSDLELSHLTHVRVSLSVKEEAGCEKVPKQLLQSFSGGVGAGTWKLEFSPLTGFEKWSKTFPECENRNVGVKCSLKRQVLGWFRAGHEVLLALHCTK